MNQCSACSALIETTRSCKRLCDSCFAEKMRLRARKYYAENRAAIITRRTRAHTCGVCGTSFTTQNDGSRLCHSCVRGKQHTNLGYELFHCGKLARLHRAVAVAILGADAVSGKAVHHLDGNGKNNTLSNLIVLGSGDHARLHRYINTQPTLGLAETSLAHLDSTGVSYIKLAEAFTGSREELDERLRRLKPTPTHRATLESATPGLDPKVPRERITHTSVCACCGGEFEHKPSAPRKYCGYACSREASKRVARPSKEELHAMLWKSPAQTVAQSLGVTSTAVAKWCASYGVDKPPRGYWAKIHAGKDPNETKLRTVVPRVPWRHGSNNGYCKHACRCAACTEAHKLAARKS